MSEHRAKGQFLHKPEDGTFGRVWTYNASHCPSAETAFEAGFFNTHRDNLLAGDSIRLVRISNGHVVAYGECLVLHVSKTDVVVKPLGAMTIDRPEDENPKVETRPASFVQGTGEAKWNAGKKQHEVIVAGAVVFATKDKDLAATCRSPKRPTPEGD
jgi:hypothetical protein